MLCAGAPGRLRHAQGDGRAELHHHHGAYLAEALRQQGHTEEALEFAEEARAGAADDDTPTQVAWRSTRAKALVGDLTHAEEAERLAAEAVEIASGTDDLAMQGDTLLDHGQVLAWLGEVDRARAGFEASVGRYRAKQNRVGERLAQQALADLAAAGTVATSR